jgi:hypothetical protein
LRVVEISGALLTLCSIGVPLNMVSTLVIVRCINNIENSVLNFDRRQVACLFELVSVVNPIESV